jgi:hypothetical protein
MTRRHVALVVVLAGAAAAHDADVLYVSARSAEQGGALEEVVTLTGAALGQLAPVDADGDGVLSQADLDARGAAIAAGVWDEMPLAAAGTPCARGAPTAALREGYVELTARFECGAGELRQDFKILRVLPANFRVVLGSQVEGEAGKASAQGTMTALTVPRPPPPGAFSRARFENGVADGVAAVLWVGAFAALLLVLGAASGWRQGLVAGALCAVGLAAGAAVPGRELVPGLVLVGASLAVAVTGRTHAVLALLLGMALAARVGGGPWSASVGLAAGAVGAMILAGPAAVAVGRLVQRRPRAWRVLRWVAAAIACFAVGFRVAA